MKALQARPGAQRRGASGPPQSMSVSVRFFTPSWLVAPHLPVASQMSDRQSVETRQCLGNEHLRTSGPPQSMSVSLPFLTESFSVGAAHTLSVQM